MAVSRHERDDRATAPRAPARRKGVAESWRAWYRGSFLRDLFRLLGAIDFGDRILVFGACLLLSVLPLIIVLSAYASHRVQDDIARHLGLSAQGARIVDGLFRASAASFNLAVLVSLLLSFAGTVAVARSVQVIYERAFDQPPLAQRQRLLRCVVWVVVVSAVVLGDAAVGKVLRDEPGGAIILGVVELAVFVVFFWWSFHFLLGGREPWRRLAAAAVITALFWIGLGVFAAFYFSSTIVSDSKTYGTIGVTFTLVTWFIAMGAVIALGAVIGAVWQRRRNA